MAKYFVCITGAAGGLGKAFAMECASRGWDLYLTDISSDKLERLANGLKELHNVKVLFDSCDLADPEARRLFWQRISNLGIDFSMLINVAGIDFDGAFMDRASNEIDTILKVNIEAAVAMTRAVIENQRTDQPLYIINVSSMAGFYSMPMKAIYAASYRFLLDFSRAMRQEQRPRNIRVMALYPAGLATKGDTINSITSQGWAGQVTTLQTGQVVFNAINRALVGYSVNIPRWINRTLTAMSSLLPADWVAWLIWRRWQKTRAIAARLHGQIGEPELRIDSHGLHAEQV